MAAPTVNLDLAQPDNKDRPWGDAFRNNMAKLEARLTTRNAGDPNGSVEGFFTGQYCWDTAGEEYWICTLIGVPAVATWAREALKGSVVTSVDNNPGTLNEKVVVGAGLIKTVLSPGGDEDLEIKAAGASQVSATDTVSDYLVGKIVGGVGITISTLNPGADEDLSIAADQFIPDGTEMVFHEASAPTGWTINATVNDRVLRVNNTVGKGQAGDWTITGVTVDGHILTVPEMPSHSHTWLGGGNFLGTEGGAGTLVNIDHSTADQVPSQASTQFAGGGASHLHGLTSDAVWRPAYVDLIICSKNVVT